MEYTYFIFRGKPGNYVKATYRLAEQIVSGMDLNKRWYRDDTADYCYKLIKADGKRIIIPELYELADLVIGAIYDKTGIGYDPSRFYRF